jgi:NhaP-type Na+/H+ or K+/H+ antiporter
MLTSLALIYLVGLSLAAIFGKLKLPRLIGMLLTGILLGPFVLDFLDPQILGISAELRKMALVIILIKAGLSLNFSDLKKVGRPALLMAFLPATFEIVAFLLFAPMLLDVSRVEALLMGSVLAAVSPAVVVPRMVTLMDSVGVFLCLLGTDLNKKERLYTVFAYLPKATVQAAIGSVPLSMGLPCGNIILSVAVLGILITAPLGAILMDSTKNKLLK